MEIFLFLLAELKVIFACGYFNGGNIALYMCTSKSAHRFQIDHWGLHFSCVWSQLSDQLIRHCCHFLITAKKKKKEAFLPPPSLVLWLGVLCSDISKETVSNLIHQGFLDAQMFQHF